MAEPGDHRLASLLARAIFFLSAALWAAVGCAVDSAADLVSAPYHAPVAAGRIANPDLSEASGMASSRRRSGCFWMVADSGNGPVIHAVGPAGEDLGSVALVDAANGDWEDLASFERYGVAYLLIADTGDNRGARKTSLLYLVKEPDIPGRPGIAEKRVKPEQRLRFRFPDGPKDCEAVAVDPDGRTVLLLTKRLRPPNLYAVDLPEAPMTEVTTARRLMAVTAIPVPSNAELLADPIFGRFRSQPTAMDISPDGRWAAVLTYGGGYLFAKNPGERWVQAFSRAPAALPPFDLRQAESICFGSDGRTLFMSSEKSPAPLLRLEPMSDMRP